MKAGNPPGLGPLGARLLSLLFIIMGVSGFYSGAKEMTEARASESWVAAEGWIVSSSVESNRRRKGGVNHRAKVAYEFRIGDRTLLSDHISFGQYASRDPDHARCIVERYPVGAVVTVYHHPDDPGRSVLEKGVSSGAWFMPVLGLVMFVAGLAMFILLPRAILKHRAKVANAS